MNISTSIREDFHNRELFLNDQTQHNALAKLIDSTLLKMDATQDAFLKLFSDANQYQFKSVCVPPSMVKLAHLHCKDVLICTVVGFPNGYNTTHNKVLETQNALDKGANEIDFVNNVIFVKSNMWIELQNEYSALVNSAQKNVTKLILETSLLTKEEIVKCTQLAIEAGVNIIKTSTGFGSRGASLEDISLIQKTLHEFDDKTKMKVGIKASGGVRTREDALNMLKAGATRIGTSNGATMVSE